MYLITCILHQCDTGTKKVQEAVKGGQGGGRYFPINAVQVTIVVKCPCCRQHVSSAETSYAHDHIVSPFEGYISHWHSRFLHCTHADMCPCVHLCMCLHAKILPT